MSRASGWPVLIVGLVALSAAAAWLASEPEAAASGPARPPYVLPVTLATVERGTVQPRVPLTGSVLSARWAGLAFELAGTLAELTVEEGQRVELGQLVARLSDEDQRLALASARAALAVTERELALLQAGSRAEEIERLAAELDAAIANEELAQLEVERRRELAEASDVSRAEMDRVEAGLRAAEARQRAVSEQLAMARAGSRAEDLAIAEARRVQAAAAADRAARELAKTGLHAPWPGVVIRRHGSVGDHLAPGAALLELADTDALEIHVEVPPAYGLRLGSEQQVVVRLDEAPDFALATRLDAVPPAADLVSRNFRALVRLGADEAGGLLKPGMFARVELLLAPIEEALVVPADALRKTADGLVVAVADAAGAETAGGEAAGGDRGPALVARLVPVRLLGTEGPRAAIEPLDGRLAPGERVIVTGVDLAYDGVSLLPRDDRPGTPP